MLKQPQGVKLLTNISVVRLVKGEKKFEIACYPNTVAAWRQGVFVISIIYNKGNKDLKE
ncbi:hypothetical protein ENU1_147710 [Entamoeba nuttalli P19]|uniref:Ribosome maturation protein SDO1/SBDS N-terminal domain-containing protein n=1 Tax=Entamoeba nuttalli (strain P19) TaxID=1076696 RepID=K2GUZ8_ENTNP|nr:hypothetical protein ENU1_147710 [Entamoeba nuttalli P19]EKE38928.1 hypothetical protein ENU1_147710 [Entamoeba nuttalli P19]|eukprot:XP_008858738.1 hypothetical protein ENU1_147710 [Entamoeba nuttalli P19]